MKKAFTILLGIICIFLSHTLFASGAFLVDFLIYSIALYLFFFNREVAPGLTFLVGVTIASELMLSNLPGQASLIAIGLLVLYHLFRERLHFTSRFLRFEAALFLLLLFYNLLFFNFPFFFMRLQILSIGFILASIASYLLYFFKKSPEYEHI